jgi:hypothetical protein
LLGKGIHGCHFIEHKMIRHSLEAATFSAPAWLVIGDFMFL